MSLNRVFLVVLLLTLLVNSFAFAQAQIGDFSIMRGLHWVRSTPEEEAECGFPFYHFEKNGVTTRVGFIPEKIPYSSEEERKKLVDEAVKDLYDNHPGAQPDHVMGVAGGYGRTTIKFKPEEGVTGFYSFAWDYKAIYTIIVMVEDNDVNSEIYSEIVRSLCTVKLPNPPKDPEKVAAEAAAEKAAKDAAKAAEDAVKIQVGNVVFLPERGFERASAEEEKINGNRFFRFNIDKRFVSDRGKPARLEFFDEMIPCSTQQEYEKITADLYKQYEEKYSAFKGPNGVKSVEGMKLFGMSSAFSIRFYPDEKTTCCHIFFWRDGFLIKMQAVIEGQVAETPYEIVMICNHSKVVVPEPKAPPVDAASATPAVVASATPAEDKIGDFAFSLEPSIYAKTPDEVPWQQPSATGTIKGLEADSLVLAQTVDFNKISTQAYNGLVIAAMAAMRQIQGPMSPQETKAFENRWAPLFDFPTPEAEAYFKKLNPLLAEFLTTSSMLSHALEQYQAVFEDSLIAAETEVASGAFEATARLETILNLMKSLQKRMNEIAAQVKELGNPPDPVAAKLRARRRHREEMGELANIARKFPVEGRWEGFQEHFYNGGLIKVAAYLRVVSCDEQNRLIVFLHEGGKFFLLNPMVPAEDGKWLMRSFPSHHWGGFTEVTFDGDEMIMNNLWRDPDQSSWPIDGYFLPIRRTVMTRVAEIAEDEPFPGGIEADYVQSEVERLKELTFKELYDFSSRRLGSYTIEIASGVVKIPYDRLVTESDVIDYLEQDLAKYQALQAEFEAQIAPLNEVPYSLAVDKEIKRIANSLHMPPDTSGTIKNLQNALAHRGIKVPDMPAKTKQAAAEPLTGVDEKSDPAVEAADRAEAVAMHNENIRYLEKSLEKDMQSLAQAKDNSEQQLLEWRIMNARADIQAERDLITSINSQTIVRTRTELDDYMHNSFVTNIVANQSRMSANLKLLSDAQTLAAMLPADEADKAREFIARHADAKTVATGDVKEIKQAYDAIFKKVEGYYESAQAAPELKSAENRLAIYNVGQTFITAGVAGVFGRPAGAAYAGVTGYISGGPADGISNLALWYSPMTAMAQQAFEGYRSGGFITGETGLKGAADRAVVTFVGMKALEAGAAGIGKLSNYCKGRWDLHVFKTELHQGRKLAMEMGELERKILAARSSGVPAAEVMALERQAMEKAADISVSFHARKILKLHAPPADQLAYNKYLTRHLEKVDEVLLKKFQQEGWDISQIRFKDFRNASSFGSVGIDRDFGVSILDNNVLIKNGKPSTFTELQKDGTRLYNEAFKEVVGRDAGQALHNFTTPVHAESFMDLKMISSNLGDPAKVAELNRRLAAQTGNTIQYKGLEALGMTKELGKLGAHQEACRGLAKELDTKLIKLATVAAQRPNITAASAERLKRSVDRLKEMRDIFDSYARDHIDPLTASRKIRQLTGGKEIPEILGEVKGLTEMLFNFSKLGKP